MSSASKKIAKPPVVAGFASNSLLKQPSTKPIRSSVTSSLSGSSNVTNSPLLQSKNKAQSQEDLTKVKDRTSTRNKHLTGGSNSTSGSRRAGSNKETQKIDKSRDKTKTSSMKPGSSSSSSSSRSSSLINRKVKDSSSRNKSESDKVGLETKIRDLMVLAKTKDSEIRSLKTKLDQMMTLLSRQHGDDVSTPRNDFTSLTKLADENSHGEDSLPLQEIINLKNENMRLKEEVDSMMLKVKEAEKPAHSLHQLKMGFDLEALSNEDALSSSLDDLASASSGDALRSMSRSTSTDNLLDDISTSGTTSSNGGVGGRGDERNAEDVVSESSSVTVACLTERIHRMEESHISTNEELEATVQELNDLQMSVPELTIDNTRLRQQKDFLEEKLLKTENRLKEQTSEASHLRVLVSDHFSEASGHSDLQQQYLVLLNEREQLLRIQESMSEERQLAATEKKEAQDLIEALQERMRHLERELDQSNTDKSILDKRLKTIKDSAEEEHLKMMKKLEDELQSERQHNENLLKMSSSPQDVAEVVEGLRNENQELEERYLLLEEEYNQCQSENEKLDERVAELEEEQEAADAKSKLDLSELSELIDRLQEDLRIKQASLDETNDTLFVMEDSIEQHIAVKKHDNHIIQQLQNQISSLKEERFRLEKEIQQLKKEQRNQSEEWKQFQTDLQMAVMIANDMKAETQADVLRLREENQALDEQITKLRVENEQLRRKRISNVSATSACILEAVAMRQPSSRSSADIAVLRENYKRRASENSPGVQSLIKSFDNQSPSAEAPAPLSPIRSQSVSPTEGLPSDPPTVYTPVKPANITSPSSSSPITATVSPIQRHSSKSSMTPQQVVSPTTPSIVSKLHPSATSSAGSKPGTPDSGRSVSTSDHSQTSVLRRNSGTQESRSSESRKQPLTDVLDRVTRHQTPSTTSSKHRTLSLSTPSGDSLTSLARRYGGSKRNALLKWCQEKTSGYNGIDITNFSSSWSDGLALCALLHSYLPAHIPYESLRQTYATANDDATRRQLQAKNFRLAFAAAESVGIDPTLTKEEMTTKERPDWQRVMSYVSQIYKYFET